MSEHGPQPSPPDPISESLQDLAIRRLTELGDEAGPLGVRTAAERTRGLISYENLRKIVRGNHGGRISDRTAEGLALALDVPASHIYRAAGVPRPPSKFVVPQRLDRLTAAQRQLLLDIGSALLDAYDRGRRDARDEG